MSHESGRSRVKGEVYFDDVLQAPNYFHVVLYTANYLHSNSDGMCISFLVVSFLGVRSGVCVFKYTVPRRKNPDRNRVAENITKEFCDFVLLTEP